MTDAPELQVVPIEDLDKIEKLLDVCINTLNMPNLAAIKQACMEELVQYNAALVTAQAAAMETYKKELAEYEAAEAAKAKKAADSKPAEKNDYSKERSYAS